MDPGCVLPTNGSGSGMPKNLHILQIRIRNNASQQGGCFFIKFSKETDCNSF
jgi:hypothetical protein